MKKPFMPFSRYDEIWDEGFKAGTKEIERLEELLCTTNEYIGDQYNRKLLPLRYLDKEVRKIKRRHAQEAKTNGKLD